MGGKIGSDEPSGEEEGGDPDRADHAAGVRPGAEESEMEDHSAYQEPHFEIREEVAKNEDGEGWCSPTGAIKKFDPVARRVVNRHANALPLQGDDDEDRKNGCGTTDTGRRAHPFPDGGNDGEQWIEKAGHERIGLPRFVVESTRVTP